MNKKMMTTAFAGLWLIVSCVTHAGIIYELDCSDLRCSDDIKLSGSFEFEDGITLTTGKEYGGEALKGFGINYDDVTQPEIKRFGSDLAELIEFKFMLDSDGMISDFRFSTSDLRANGDEHYNDSYSYVFYATSYYEDDYDEFGPHLHVSWKRATNLREAVDVPAPHAATILALGILGLATRRFKKQS